MIKQTNTRRYIGHRRAHALAVALAVCMCAAALSAQETSDESGLSPAAVARILAGLNVDPSELGSLDTAATERHIERVERHWQRWEDEIGAPMAAWRDENLTYNAGERVFYPFSGPDFITAHRLYPNASHYTLVAKQSAGRVPDLEARNPGFRAIARLFDENTEQFGRIGFFVTAELNDQFSRGSAVVEGLTPMIMVMVAREGYTVQRVEPIRINDDGTDVMLHDGDWGNRRTWDSARFTTTRDATGEEVIVDYVYLDLANSNLDDAPTELAWLNRVAQARVVFKAASHLPQYETFSTVVGAILDNAISIVQDETAVEYSTLNERFETRLFGAFDVPNRNFSRRLQRSLAAAFDERDDAVPLDFTYGYLKSLGSTIVYAHQRRAEPVVADE